MTSHDAAVSDQLKTWVAPGFEQDKNNGIWSLENRCAETYGAAWCISSVI